jgi:hypothetical protein
MERGFAGPRTGLNVVAKRDNPFTAACRVNEAEVHSFLTSTLDGGV